MEREDEQKKEILKNALSLKENGLLDSAKSFKQNEKELGKANSQTEIKSSVRGLGKEVKKRIPRYGEYVKKYTFSMRPSSHEKLVRLAREQSYPSVSKFLSDLIDSIE